MTADLELTTLLQSILKYALRFLQTEIGILYLCPIRGDALQVAAISNPDSPAANTRIRLGDGVAGKVWATGEILIVEDYASWPEQIPSLARRLQHRPLVGIPQSDPDAVD